MDRDFKAPVTVASFGSFESPLEELETAPGREFAWSSGFPNASHSFPACDFDGSYLDLCDEGSRGLLLGCPFWPGAGVESCVFSAIA